MQHPSLGGDMKGGFRLVYEDEPPYPCDAFLFESKRDRELGPAPSPVPPLAARWLRGFRGSS
jgi:hypothetical protein